MSMALKNDEFNKQRRKKKHAAIIKICLGQAALKGYQDQLISYHFLLSQGRILRYRNLKKKKKG